MVHYDIPGARRTFQAEVAALRKQEDALLASDNPDLDAAFIHAQRRFHDHRINFLLEGMRCENIGLGREQSIGAAAKVLGDMLGTLTLSCVGPRERQIVKNCFDRALAECIMPPGEASNATEPVQIVAEEGGNA